MDRDHRYGNWLPSRVLLDDLSSLLAHIHQVGPLISNTSRASDPHRQQSTTSKPFVENATAKDSVLHVGATGPVLKPFKAHSLPSIQGVVLSSSGGRSFEFSWAKATNARSSSGIDKIDLRVARDRRDDEIDALKVVAKFLLIVVVRNDDLIVLGR